MSAAEVPADLIQIFREEAAEHLDGMVEGLLAVEGGRASSEGTDALFRHAHSIKGNAGMVGLQEAGSIANAIARATAAGAMPKSVMSRRIWLRTSTSSMELSSWVSTNPGDIDVVRTTPSVDSWRRPSMRVRTAFLVAA